MTRTIRVQGGERECVFPCEINFRKRLNTITVSYIILNYDVSFLANISRTTCANNKISRFVRSVPRIGRHIAYSCKLRHRILTDLVRPYARDVLFSYFCRIYSDHAGRSRARFELARWTLLLLRPGCRWLLYLFFKHYRPCFPGLKCVLDDTRIQNDKFLLRILLFFFFVFHF